jgi:hypothetical protein
MKMQTYASTTTFLRKCKDAAEFEKRQAMEDRNNTTSVLMATLMYLRPNQRHALRKR